MRRLVPMFAWCLAVPSFAAAVCAGAEEDRSLFQSDMSLMNGMTPHAPPESDPSWHVMDLGIATAAYNRQGGLSGGHEIESSNWNMVHAARGVGPGRLSLMMMNSLEPATYPDPGSRQLFQTGESADGKPLVDRQHPHDFFMNLSATYRIGLGGDAGAWIQLAPVGEPALGPAGFMHRASAGENHAAPLGHHWEDSTHIAYNVVTLGGGWRWFALEASVFHGAEPDEHRWNIDGGRIDSASVRARLFLGEGWSGQLSYGYLRNPEPLEPGNLHRMTAAVYYGAEGDRPLAFSLVWGRNVEAHGTSDAVLLEGAYRLTTADQIYGRVESVEKDFALLLTKRLPDEHGPRRLARIWAFTAGYLRDFPTIHGLDTGVGVDVTAYSFPSALDPAYGASPVSIHAFLRLRWGREAARHHAMHHHPM
jgi:hypothetical protein